MNHALRQAFHGKAMPYVHGVADGDTPADVAELVDALVSGTSGSNVVGVQVSPSALPNLLNSSVFRQSFFCDRLANRAQQSRHTQVER